MDNNEGIYLGVRRGAWGNGQPFGLELGDCLRHLYIIGKTGSGKSTLLKHIVGQHIAANRGVAVIDPHGDLAEELLDYVPRHRTEDVVYFNPADVARPMAWNPLARVPAERRHLVASGLVGAFKSIWGDSWGPRMEYLLANAIAALLDCENASLLGVTKLLTSPRYRRWVARQVKDPLLRSFWLDDFESWEVRYRREAIAPIENKLGRLFLAGPIRNVLGQVRTQLDLRAVMERGQIFIANLSKGALGEDKAHLLGSLLVAQFAFATLCRGELEESERRPFFLVADEFHSFGTDAFGVLLSEARKFGVGLTLAHQFTEQLLEEVRPAVFGNVGSMVAFQVGYSDAEILSKQFGAECPPHLFVGLNRFGVLARVRENGEERPAFEGEIVLRPLPRHGRGAVIVARSRERYAVSRSGVEDKILRWVERWRG